VSRPQALLFVSAFVLLGLIAGTLWLSQSPETAPGLLRAVTGLDDDQVIDGTVTLFFPGSDGRLHPEVRGFETGIDNAEFARRIVTGLLSGPDSEGLFAPLPRSTRIGSVVVSADGTLYLDLASTEHARPPVTGSERELLAAYSLVNSICTNVPGIRNVVLLWNSQQLKTFAGNLDTTRPLSPNARLVSATT